MSSLSDLIRPPAVAAPAREAARPSPAKGRRIILINSFLNSGGSQQATIRLARQLARRGHEAEAWFLYRKGDFFAPEIEGVRTRVMIDKPSLTVLDHARIAKGLWQSFRRDRPDAVVTFLPLAASLGQGAAMAAGVSARVTSQRVPGSTYGRAMRLMDRAFGTLGVFREIVCVSDAVEASFSTYPERYRQRLSVVHNGIEWSPPGGERRDTRRRLGIDDTEMVLLAVGRIQAQKNFGLALRAIEGVAGVRLVIAGDGPDREALEQAARRADLARPVLFLGNQTPTAVGELLAAADAFIQPSLFEGQSNALLEAMHAGLPILASDIPEQRETLALPGGGHAGRLIPLDDPSAWRDAVVALRDEPDARAALGRRAKAHVNDRFALETMVSRFEQLILSHLEH